MNDFDAEQLPPKPQSSAKGFSTILLVVALGALVFTMTFRQTTVPTKAPEIRVAGWLNGPGPTPEELHGKVIVLDAWAYWCGPCRASAPEMVRLYEKYRSQGVVFLGITGEGEDADPYSRRFLEETKITWPNGYGARQTLMSLKNEFIPERWVIDRDYNIIWYESSGEPIEAAIDRALAKK